MADLFVPGLSDLSRKEVNLNPDVWRARQPAQFVSGRIILLADLVRSQAAFAECRISQAYELARLSSAGSMPFRHMHDRHSSEQTNVGVRPEVAANSGLSEQSIQLKFARIRPGR